MAKKRVSYDAPVEKITDPDQYGFYGISLDEEQRVFRDAIWNPDIDVVFVDARAGSGKTLIATATANLLVQAGYFDKLIYIVSSYGEKRQGYLPGDLTQKSEVYFEPFYQALIKCGVDPNKVINDEPMVNQKNGTGYITCLTHTFLRGTNLNNSVVILDECQNYDFESLKKTITRCDQSEGPCKLIVIGHDKQCDLDNPDDSGFVDYLQHFKNHDRVAICQLTHNHRGWISEWADMLEKTNHV